MLHTPGTFKPLPPGLPCEGVTGGVLPVPFVTGEPVLPPPPPEPPGPSGTALQLLDDPPPPVDVTVLKTEDSPLDPGPPGKGPPAPPPPTVIGKAVAVTVIFVPDGVGLP